MEALITILSAPCKSLTSLLFFLALLVFIILKKDERPLFSGFFASGHEGRSPSAFLAVSSDGEDSNLCLNEETQLDRFMIKALACELARKNRRHR